MKSLWEGGSSPGLESNPNPVSVDNGHVTVKEESDVELSGPDAKLPVKREAWVDVSDKDTGIGEAMNVCAVKEEKEEIDRGSPKRVSSSIKENSEASSKASHVNDDPPSARLVDAEEKSQSHSSDREELQRSMNPTQMSSAVGAAHQEPPKQKPTRRGGRGRKPKSPRNESAPETSEEKPPGDRKNKLKAGQKNSPQKNYDDLKGGSSKTSPAANKPRGEHSEMGQDTTLNPGRGADSGPRQEPRQKERPVSAKEGDKKGPKRNKQGAKEIDKKAPDGNKQGAKEIEKKAPEGNKQGTKEIDKKKPERNKQSAKETDKKTPEENKQGVREIDKKEPECSKQSVKEIDKKAPEGDKQGPGTRDPDMSPGYSSRGGRRRTPNRGRKPPRSRTNSGTSVGEKDDSRKRTSSMPEKRPSKDS